jgi:hypothetical protein
MVILVKKRKRFALAKAALTRSGAGGRARTEDTEGTEDTEIFWVLGDVHCFEE